MTLLPLCGDQKVEDNGQQGTYAVWLLATQPEAEDSKVFRVYEHFFAFSDGIFGYWNHGELMISRQFQVR